MNRTEMRIQYKLAACAIAAASLFIPGCSSPGQKLGHDEGMIYKNGHYDVRAASRNGNRGGTAPIDAGTGRAKKLTVRSESFWMILGLDDGPRLNPDGTPAGVHGPMRGFLAPRLTPWSLIGRWEVFNNDSGSGNFGKTTPLGDFFQISYGGTYDVPDHVGDSRQNVYLRYFCNDEQYSDNAGGLHVFEDYHN